MMSRHAQCCAVARAFLRRNSHGRRHLLPSNTNIITTFGAFSIIPHQQRYKTGRGCSDSTTPSSAPPDSNASQAKRTDFSGVKHQVEHRAKETIGIRLTERVVERVAEAAEQGVERAAAAKTLTTVAERAAVNPLAKQAAVRTAERAAVSTKTATATAARTWPRASRRILGVLSPTPKIVARVGRGCLIAVPLAGAGFAAWIGRSDYRRTRRELELARVRLARALDEHRSATAAEKEGELPEPTLDTSTVICFGVSAAADSVNVVAHLVAAYGLYQGWIPDGIVNAEIASWISAVVSTGAAVRGEYLTAGRRSAELDSEEHGGGGGGGGTGGGDVERVVSSRVSAEEKENEEGEEERRQSANDPQDGAKRWLLRTSTELAGGGVMVCSRKRFC